MSSRFPFSIGVLAKLLGLCSVVVLGGCATMFSRTSDEISIDSDPKGAEVSIDGEVIGVTPLKTVVARDTLGTKYITVKKKGYRTRQVLMEKSLDSRALFNFGFISTTFGATSWGIDALTGAMVEYSPNSFNIDLKRKKDDDDDEDASVRQEERSRFVSRSFNAIQQDLSRGDGDWLRTYIDMRSREPGFDALTYASGVTNRRSDLMSMSDSRSLFSALESIN